MSSENKVIKDDNDVILILIYDIFAENLMDVETELSNEIRFIKVDNSGLEAGVRNIIYEHGSLHRYFEKKMEIIKILHECHMRMIDEIRGKQMRIKILRERHMRMIDEIRGKQMRIEKIFHDLSLSV